MKILTTPDRVISGSAQRVIEQGEPAIRRGRRQSIPAEALLLRSWAVQLLGTAAGPPEPAWQAAAHAGPASWELFLRLERATLAIQTRLDERDAWQRLPAEIATLIRALARQELRRVLSARAQVRTVARLAASRGWTVMVLKGGAAVAEGALIDLGDVDILVESEMVAQVATALEELGFEQHGHDAATAHHLSARVMPNAMHIEVHRSLKGGAGLENFRAAATPLGGEPSLWRQGTVDQLHYLLVHSTLQHPERAGRIRDLLLIGHALRTATPAEIAEVEHGLAKHESTDLILGVLESARAMNDGEFTSDPHRGVALRMYVLYHRFPWLNKGGGRRQIMIHAVRLAIRGRSLWWSAYRQLRAAPMNSPSAAAPVAWLHRYSRPLANATRQFLRLVTFTVATACAILIDGEAKRLERGWPRR